MARGGVKNKINKRIARLKWLLYANPTPPPWATAQKLQKELDFLKSTLLEKKPITPTHSNIKTLICKTTNKTLPHQPKEIPKEKEKCPGDCPGPLESVSCKYTCAPGKNKKA